MQRVVWKLRVAEHQLQGEEWGLGAGARWPLAAARATIKAARACGCRATNIWRVSSRTR